MASLLRVGTGSWCAAPTWPAAAKHSSDFIRSRYSEYWGQRLQFVNRCLQSAAHAITVTLRPASPCNYSSTRLIVVMDRPTSLLLAGDML
ncbi:hypothetical protein ABVT39_018622 [Epinephelus coioides]